MTRVFINLGMLAASAVMISACSTGKHCADGVCRTVKDGKTTYEGDPEKIARIKAEENKQFEWIATIKKKIAQAPRKPAGEKIRIVVAPGNISKEMGPYAAQYISLLEQKLKSYEGLELLNEGQMRRDLDNRAVFMALSNPKAFGGSSDGPDDESQEKKLTPERYIEEIQVFGGRADVVVFLGIGVRSKTSLVGGKGGIGLAQTDHPEITASVTSAYQFKSLNQTVQGKSLTSLGLAGIDKTGRASSGELKGATRNLDQDLPAIQELAKFIADKSAGLRPTMPSVAALDKIHSEYSDDSPEARQRALLKGIKGLFGGER